MASLKLNGDTSGEITISAPAVAGTHTLTLPSLTANILTDGTALPAIDGSALTNLPAPAALSTASGSAPSYSARAWVSLDGVSGTPNIDASGNISSITDNGTGDYTLNFTTAMADNLYALVMSVRRGAARVFWTSTLSTSSARVIAANLSQVQGDEAMSVAIFR